MEMAQWVAYHLPPLTPTKNLTNMAIGLSALQKPAKNALSKPALLLIIDKINLTYILATTSTYLGWFLFMLNLCFFAKNM